MPPGDLSAEPTTEGTESEGCLAEVRMITPHEAAAIKGDVSAVLNQQQQNVKELWSQRHKLALTQQNAFDGVASAWEPFRIRRLAPEDF